MIYSVPSLQARTAWRALVESQCLRFSKIRYMKVILILVHCIVRMMIDHLMILCWFRLFFFKFLGSSPAGPEWWRAGWCQPGAGGTGVWCLIWDEDGKHGKHHLVYLNFKWPFVIERHVKLIELTEFHVILLHEQGKPEVRFQRQAELQRRSREGEETWSADKGSSTGISWDVLYYCALLCCLPI